MNNILTNLKLPLIAAPMFLVSGPVMVKEACNSGIIGSFPMTNARTIEDLEKWFIYLNENLNEDAAPLAANIIVHTTYPRFNEELEMIKKYKPQIVITALGSPARVIKEVHEYGGMVFADVNSIGYARKAALTGVDGLVCVGAGAGGHTGQLTPFAFVRAVRSFFSGIIILAGGMSRGEDILAAQVLGADLCYMGTRFITTDESLASKEYKEMIVESSADQIIQTDKITGVPAHFMTKSLEQAGIDLTKSKEVDFSGMSASGSTAKAWKDIWSAGQGVDNITNIASVSEVVNTLVEEYNSALENVQNLKKA